MAEKQFVVRHGLNVANNLLVANSGKVGINTDSAVVSFEIAANDAVHVPVGNTSQRPTGANGQFRYNSETGEFEGYANSAWGGIGAGGGYYKGNDGTVGKSASIANLLRINANTQSANITIAAGENALMVGPITVSNGFSLTIDTGGRVVIA